MGLDWEKLFSYVTSNKRYGGSSDKAILVPNAYLNLRLLNPSSSGKTVYLTELKVSSDLALWGRMQTDGTAGGSATGASAVSFLVGAAASPKGTLSWSIDGTLPYSGNIYDVHRAPADDYADRLGISIEELLAITAGHAVLAGYGPVAATTNVAVSVRWLEM